MKYSVWYDNQSGYYELDHELMEIEAPSYWEVLVLAIMFWTNMFKTTVVITPCRVDPNFNEEMVLARWSNYKEGE